MWCNPSRWLGWLGFFGKPTTWGLPKYTLRYVSGQTNVAGWKMDLGLRWMYFSGFEHGRYSSQRLCDRLREGGISSGLFSKPCDSLPVGKLESRSSSNHWFYPVFGAFRAFMDIHLWFFGSRKKTAVWFQALPFRGSLLPANLLEILAFLMRGTYPNMNAMHKCMFDMFGYTPPLLLLHWWLWFPLLEIDGSWSLWPRYRYTDTNVCFAIVFHFILSNSCPCISMHILWCLKTFFIHPKSFHTKSLRGICKNQLCKGFVHEHCHHFADLAVCEDLSNRYGSNGSSGCLFCWRNLVEDVSFWQAESEQKMGWPSTYTALLFGSPVYSLSVSQTYTADGQILIQ